MGAGGFGPPKRNATDLQTVVYKEINKFFRFAQILMLIISLVLNFVKHKALSHNVKGRSQYFSAAMYIKFCSYIDAAVTQILGYGVYIFCPRIEKRSAGVAQLMRTEPVDNPVIGKEFVVI